MKIVLDILLKYSFRMGILAWVLAIYQIWEIIKKWIKRKYLLPYQQEEEIENSEFYIEYYKKIQQINIYRTIIYFGVFILILWHQNIQAGSILAVATWAMIVIFQTFLMSFVVYFLVMSDYKIGDTVKIWEEVQWEIISIKPLYTHISGKNQTSEHNGKLYSIPNYQIRQNAITRVDLSNDSNVKTILVIRYIRREYEHDLWELDHMLIEFLEDIMETNTMETAQNYKSYIWYKYKINYEPHEEWDIKILIWYISSNHKVWEINKKILHFMENNKKSD